MKTSGWVYTRGYRRRDEAIVTSLGKVKVKVVSLPGGSAQFTREDQAAIWSHDMKDFVRKCFNGLTMVSGLINDKLQTNYVCVFLSCIYYCTLMILSQWRSQPLNFRFA